MRPFRWQASLLFLTLVATMLVAVTGTAAAAPVRAASVLPRHSDVVAAMVKAANYYRRTYPVTTLTPRNGWSWSTYFQGVHSLYLEQGDPKYLADGLAWGRSNNWSPSTERNSDSVKSLQTYFDLNKIDPSASLTTADQTMATDLANLPVTQYDWIDALFMGLPDWTRWADREQSAAYLQKMDSLYLWARDQGGTSSRCSGRTVPSPELFDAAYGLWYRDCSFIGVKDSSGKPIFWSRGNGWVIAAMAQVLQTMPEGSVILDDPVHVKYRQMLQTMAAALKPLQGSDGLWKSNLLNASQFPQGETSGTALIAAAFASGISTGDLDYATYLPVLVKAWTGLTDSLASNGFLRFCQPPGVGPGAPYTGTGPRTARTSTSAGTVNADSPPFCVGAFLLAGAEIAKLAETRALGRPVTATGQEVGNEAPRAVDGNVNTRWSASGFPKSLTVDLGGLTPVSNTMVVPYKGRAYRYRIETSTDKSTWRLAVDKTANTTAGTALDNVRGGRVLARYVRLTVTGVSGVSTTWASIQEFGIYDRLLPLSPDYLRGQPTTATSAQSTGAASRATDGDLATSWSSAAAPTTANPQNITGQLSSVAPGQLDDVTWFSRARSGPRRVNVQVSTNGTSFTTIATMSVGNSDGPWTVLFRPEVPATHVRLNITRSYSTSTVSLKQFEVSTVSLN